MSGSLSRRLARNLAGALVALAALAAVLLHWAVERQVELELAMVGPALAAVTVPRRLTRGTLTLACSGPVALELAHLAPQLIARINAHCGRVVVQRLSFVQKPPAPGATGTIGGVRAPGAAPAPVPPRVAQALGRVAGAELRSALEKLAQGVYRSNQQRGGDS